MPIITQRVAALFATEMTRDDNISFEVSTFTTRDVQKKEKTNLQYRPTKRNFLKLCLYDRALTLRSYKIVKSV